MASGERNSLLVHCHKDRTVYQAMGSPIISQYCLPNHGKSNLQFCIKKIQGKIRRQPAHHLSGRKAVQHKENRARLAWAKVMQISQQYSGGYIRFAVDSTHYALKQIQLWMSKINPLGGTRASMSFAKRFRVRPCFKYVAIFPNGMRSK